MVKYYTLDPKWYQMNDFESLGEVLKIVTIILTTEVAPFLADF